MKGPPKPKPLTPKELAKRFPPPTPEELGWAQIQAALMGAWRHRPSEGHGDRHAWILIWAGLAHFIPSSAQRGDFTAADRARAFTALGWGTEKRKTLEAHRYLDAVLNMERLGAQHGLQPIENWKGYAEEMCDIFERPRSDVPRLTNMLENLIEAKGRGKPPKGKFTRNSIVALLMGEKETSLAAKVDRERKRFP
jgi:hypothetical protein